MSWGELGPAGGSWFPARGGAREPGRALSAAGTLPSGPLSARGLSLPSFRFRPAGTCSVAAAGASQARGAAGTSLFSRSRCSVGKTNAKLVNAGTGSFQVVEL